jgi:glucose/arabinose dehydrogenase
MRRGAAATVAATLVSAGAFAGAAAAATPPTSPTGHKVRLIATGMTTPTSFAWGHRAMFAGDGTQISPTQFAGGVYQIKKGKARKLRGSPLWVGGMAFHKRVLYLSAVTRSKSGALKSRILAWRHWNGRNFTRRRSIYTAPAGFQGFNGLAFGPDGRLYVGADVGLFNANDSGPASTSPYLYDILSMSPRGRNLKVFATGIRQPWQMAFPSGSSSPLVTDLGPDTGNPPDLLLRVKAGDNFGFPTCDWTPTGNTNKHGNGKTKTPSKCRGFAKPLVTFTPHTDPAGIGIIGNTAYVGELGFALAPKVISLPVSGQGTPKTLINGTGAIIGLGTHNGYVYFSQAYYGSTGPTGPAQIFRVKP